MNQWPLQEPKFDFVSKIYKAHIRINYQGLYPDIFRYGMKYGTLILYLQQNGS